MLKIPTWIFIALLLFGAASAEAQHSALGMPRLSITEENGKTWQLAVKNVKVDISVAGSFATTTLDLTFYNNSRRVLEGELNFPLPEGQTVSRFAMDVNGKLREGAVVEKDKGRVVFEEIVRRRVDPGLIEMTEGNVFRTRVYPIPARGTKRIIVAYCEEIISDSTGMVYRLPLDFPDELDKFELNALVFSEFREPQIITGEYKNIEFEKDGNAFAAGVTYYDYEAKSQFEMLLPEPEAKQSVFVEKYKDKTYFLVNFTASETSTSKAMPQKICILYDNSSSGALRNLEQEQEMLNEYFSRNRNCIVEFVSFNIFPRSQVTFLVRNGNWDNLKNHIDNLVYDGGTRLGCLCLKDYGCDEFMLFSDGMSNFGEREIELNGKPVNSINSSQAANHSYLNFLAYKTGGQYINLMNRNAAEAAGLLTTLPYSFISAKYNDIDITEVYTPVAKSAGRNYSIAGILLNPKSEIELNFGYGNVITHTERIIIDAAGHETKSGFIPRIWAQKKIAFLDMDYESNKDAITALGKEFSIVTRNTSLIVLETLQDYLRYRIEPPEEFREEYLAQIKNYSETKKTDSLQVLNNICNAFKRIKGWWSADFTPKPIVAPSPQPMVLKDTMANLSSILSYSDKLLKADSINKGVYGGIRGRILDEGGEPLIGAHIAILGTNLGSFTNIEGKYIACKVSPGNYNIRFSYPGSKERISSVYIEKNIIKNLGDIKLAACISDTICVRGQKMIQSCNIGSVTCTKTQDSKKLPVSGINSIIIMTSGIYETGDGLTVRGSRASEKQIRVDGLDVGNQFTGGFGIAGNGQFSGTGRNAGTQAEVIKGGVAAEYGEISGGIVPGSTVIPDSPRQDMSKAGKSCTINNNSLIKEFYSQPEYLKELINAVEIDKTEIYFKLKSKYGYSAAFYIDASDYFFRLGYIEQGLTVLSNLAELKTEEAQLLRTLGYKLYQYGYFKFAELVFRDVLKIRNEEPQSYRDLSLACAETGLYQEAADLMYKVITGSFDSRFNSIGDIAVNEFNDLIVRYGSFINTADYDNRLIASLPVGIRVVLGWDSDNCDMDLWVTEPGNEKCFYGHNRTASGGIISRDFTRGYGPEEYMLKTVKPGKYLILANYYGNSQQKLFNPINLKASIYLDYGTPNETRKDITFRLGSQSQTVTIAEIEIR